MVRAIFGTSSDARFSGMAKAWGATTEALRLRFNRAGGDIKKLEDWNLPQRHDNKLVAGRGFDEWYDMIMNTANLEKMELSITDSRKVLRKMYDRIVTDGLNFEDSAGINPMRGKSKIANRHQDSRYIHFKDADSWLLYNEKYSSQDAIGAMMDHITMISNEIALMETLGPNPGSAFDSMAHAVNAKTGNANAADPAIAVYANLAGRTHPHNVTAANAMIAIRNWVSFAKLPLAVISAPPDILASGFTAHYNGIPAARMLMTSLSMITNVTPGKLKANRKLASELMMSLDFMIDEAHAASRYMDVGSGGKSKGITAITSRLAAFTVKGGGLNHWTVANKMSFHFNFMKTLADPKLAGNVQMMKTFSRYGLDENDMNLIIGSTKMERNGVTFLDPSNLNQELAEKVAAMVNAETKVAVPEADAAVRGFLNRGTRRGTVAGEAIRLATMFKTFPTSMIMNQWARALHGTAQSGSGRLATAASLLVGTSIMGAGIIQLKRFLDGKEQVDWGSKDLWNEALVQGGTLSVLGDVFADDARTYGSIADFVGGPALSMADKIFWRGVLGSIDDAKKGDLELNQMLKDAAVEVFADTAVTNILPAKLLQTKLVFDRYWRDELKRQADPRYDYKKRRREMKEFQEYQQEKWW